MIKINGKYIRNIPEQVGKNKRDIFQLDTDLTALEVKVNTALAGVFHYKGSVATYSDLPASDNEVGDVYNVIDTGKNYAWDGSSWDDLGGIVDLSNYVDLTSEQTVSGHKIFSSLDGISAEKYSGMEYSSLTLNGDEGVYVTTGSSYRFVNVQGNLEPSANNTFDLGTSSYAWKDLYLSGKVIANDIASTDVLQLGKNGYIIYARGGISPLANGTRDLGGSSLAWKDIYLAGKSQFSNTAETSTQWAVEEDGYGQLVISRIYNGTKTALWEFNNVEIKPKANNTNKIGNSGRVLDTVFTTKLNDGTNTETIADISALIAYAKAQGWIS